jgi:hypothetical protein
MAIFLIVYLGLHFSAIGVKFGWAAVFADVLQIKQHM